MAEVSIDLPGGFTKTYTQRKGGATMGSWDVYLKAPTGKRLRSNPELLKHARENRLEIDPAVINLASVLPRDYRNFRSVKVYGKMVQELGELFKPMPDHDLELVERDMDPETEAALSSLKGDRSRGRGAGGGGGAGHGGGTPRPKKIKTPSNSVAKKSTGGGSSFSSMSRLSSGVAKKSTRKRASFSEKQLKYLERQFRKVRNPSQTQLGYLAEQLKAKTADVQDWFTKKNRLAQRPIQSFDVIGSGDAGDADSDQARVLASVGGDIAVETENAEYDIEVVNEEQQEKIMAETEKKSDEQPEEEAKKQEAEDEKMDVSESKDDKENDTSGIEDGGSSEVSQEESAATEHKMGENGAEQSSEEVQEVVA